MSTRAIYTFIGADNERHSVYKHHDGYPSGAYDAIAAALPFAWPLPRFEPDEFAAAFVCANKSWRLLNAWQALEQDDTTKALDECRDSKSGFSSGGGVRLMPDASGDPKTIAPGDIAYRYEISVDKKGALQIRALVCNYWDDKRKERCIFRGTLEAFKAYGEAKAA